MGKQEEFGVVSLHILGPCVLSGDTGNNALLSDIVRVRHR